MDVIDATLDASPESALARLRRERPDLVKYSQSSHDAALLPRNPGELSHGLRAALACRVARHTGDATLSAHYAGLFATAADGAVPAAILDPASAVEGDARLTAILRHVDMITLDPAAASADDIAALRAAGLSEAAVVSLSGLIAFVNYQARVIAGLRLLKD